MEEKKVIKISLSTLFLILALIAIIVMGFFIYKLNNDKTAEIQKSTDLQAQVDILNNKIQSLDVENSDSNGNSGDNITTINKSNELNGAFFNEKGENNSDYYVFFKDDNDDNRVNFYNNNKLYYGVYTVSENKVTINFTKKVTVGDFDYETINERKILTFISDNILKNEKNTKYINKNTISGAYVSENSVSLGGNSTDDIWYTFNYNGSVVYSDSKHYLYGTYEIKGNEIAITYYFSKNNKESYLEEYNGSKVLKNNKDNIIDEETNMRYEPYADGW